MARSRWRYVRSIWERHTALRTVAPQRSLRPALGHAHAAYSERGARLAGGRRVFALEFEGRAWGGEPAAWRAACAAWPGQPGSPPLQARGRRRPARLFEKL
eukprot:8970145-Alexandrium_andersonii.AAC.1